MTSELDDSKCKDPYFWYLVSVVCIGVVILTRGPLFSSFWLDEGISFWVVSDSFSNAFSRAYEFQGQSPLYYLLLWVIRSVCGSSEWILRLPSLLASLVSLYFLYSLTHFFAGNKRSGMAAVLLLLLSDGFLQAMFSARPYAFALTFALGSIWYFVLYLERESAPLLLRSSVCFILAYYFHYLFALSIVVHIVFLVAKPKGAKERLVLPLFLIFLAMIPGAFQLLKLVERSDDLSFAPQITTLSFFEELVPLPMLVYIAFPILFAWIVFAERPKVESLPTGKFLICLGVWYLFPFLFFGLHSLLSDTSLFILRYFLWALPAICILGGILLGSFSKKSSLFSALLILFLFGFGRELDRKWQLEDWRGAVSALSARTKGSSILLYSGLVESNALALGSDKTFQEYLLAPVSPYRGDEHFISIPQELKSGFVPSFLRGALHRDRIHYLANVKTVLGEDGSERRVDEEHLRWFKEQGFDTELVFESPGVVAYSVVSAKRKK